MIDIKLVEDIYEKIKDKLKGQEGKIVAIDVDSGEYFLGKDTFEAYERGKTKLPGKQFFFKRVGTKYAFVVGAA